MNVPGAPSREALIADKLSEMIKPYVDEVNKDPLGNVIAVKHGKAKEKQKIMFCAHMDEIGFIVTYIQDNGLVRVTSAGYIDYIAASNCRVRFENGTVGVLCPEGKTEPKDLKADKFYIDLGVKTKKEATHYAKPLN